METAEIRRRWLAFFEKNGHTVVPSAPLIHDDPNLLFVNAGMVPFKPYFLGQETAAVDPRPPACRSACAPVTSRRSARPARHGTFFQMNGNFSFGDYFKEGAIALAWELSRPRQAEGGYGLDADLIWATVYEDDDEAFAIWRDAHGVPDGADHAPRQARQLLAHGRARPRRPVQRDLLRPRPRVRPRGRPGRRRGPLPGDLEPRVHAVRARRAVRAKDDFEILGPLPKQNIDTGMGLERMATLLQGVDNLYEIDEVYPVLDRAAELTGKRYGALRAHGAQRTPTTCGCASSPTTCAPR